ncbi:hypothetical protein GCM10010923_11620 [Blastomonas marina]|uniref:C4-dicarboxylate ABC transporter n=1 Tax=Blastomonas marina TaxID=1867408 RepID=A0ABQ1FA88_9SPHN|nr:hypothetical protein GCM10010923_11620 [Blastomonas marina]
MEIGTIIVALILIWIAWKVLMGIVKFGAIALIVVAAIYFLSQGGAF